MGDMLTLIEKAEEVYEQEEAEAAAAKLFEGTFTLDDFLIQMQQVKKMGSLSSLMKMMPGMPKELRDQEIDPREISRIEAIIQSMTQEERRKPDVIDNSRRGRIATGSGTQPAQVDALIKQFKEMSKMLNRMGGLGTKKMTKARRKNDKRNAKGKGRGKGGTHRGQGGGRVTSGKPPLKLPDLAELSASGGAGGLDGIDGLAGLQGLEGMPDLTDPEALGLN
jgi:signal recognition particle subunit SRP54